MSGRESPPRPGTAGSQADASAAGRDDAAYLEALREAVELSADDAELAARVARLPGGDESVLAFLADGMARSFQPDRAIGAYGTVRFAVETAVGELDLWFAFDEAGCHPEPAAAQPDATIEIPLAVLVRIAFKELTGSEAYVGGLVKASGDVILATSIDGWFDVPTAAAVAVSA